MTIQSLRLALGRPVEYRRSFFRNLARLAVFLFGVEVATGALLALYYRPDPDGAYASVGTLTSQVTLGWLARGVHHVAGHALAAVAGLYLVRAFFLRTFLRPKGTAGWVLAAAFALLTLAFLLTGLSLPWDQEAYWRTEMTTRIVEQVPFAGRWAASFFRGGSEVGAGTLTRLFALHALVFPWLGFGLVLLARRLRREGAMK